MIKIFYYDTPDIFQHVGWWMYVVPITLVAFILLSSRKNGIKFEIFTLTSIIATLFFSSAIKNSLIDWDCLCGQAQGRYFFFAIVFLLILVIRHLDMRKSLPFKLVFFVIVIIIVFNVGSGFFIPVQADEGWKYVVKFYNPSGKYQCYIGELPNWSITVPCSKPIPSNVTGASVTFTPPIQSTTISLTPNSAFVISDILVKFMATVMPMPNGGTVQFYVDGVTMDAPITVFGGQATFSTSLLSVGTHKISASYSGDPNFKASNSNQTSVTILLISNLQGTDLSGINLQNINLSNVNLKGADLFQANLQNANLSGSDMQGVNLSQALLLGANLNGANLQSANLQGANLQNTTLTNANLQNVNLSGAILKYADIKGTNFTGSNIRGCNGCP